MVEPEFHETGEPHLAIIHTDSIYRGDHLIPAYRTAEHVGRTITMHLSLDSFRLSTSTSTLTTMLSRSHSNPTIFHSDLFGWMQLGTMPHILEVRNAYDDPSISSPTTNDLIKHAGSSS